MTCVHHDLLDGRGLTASALLLALIHELRGIKILGSSLAGSWIKPRKTPAR
jgi:hypothetical protein